ncbi:MAG: 3-coathanger stack domain-containing protein, partial [Bacteroidota bacterium]
MENDPLTSTVYLQNNPNPNAGQWRVADWDSGTTEGGSSGSPIFDNTTKRIVGMLSGGFAACGNNSADWYGKFSFGWNNNGATNPAFRLRDWLDPNNTGILAIDGYGINESDFTLSSSSTNEKNCSGTNVTNSVSYTIMVQTNSGSSDPVTLSVSGQPSGASVSFSTNPVVPGNTSTLTVGGLTSVALGNYVLNVEGTNTSGSNNLQLNLEVLNNCNIICNNITSTDVPVTIPGNTTVESDIVVTDMGSITDIDVSFAGTHDRIRDLTFELRSPDGTTIQLVDLENPCDGRQENFDFGFDDESSLSSIPCPPTTGLFYVPEQTLSAFDGEEVNGTWTLIVTDIRNARSGVLNSWQLDYCIQPMSMGCDPMLTIDGDPMNNDIIDTGTYQASNTITSTGRVTSGSDVTFEAGQSITLSPDFVAENGSTFTARIQACASASEENMVESRTEQFEFLKNNATEIAIFPNPFRSQTTIELSLAEEGEVSIQLFDVTGRQVTTVLETSSQLAGLYQYQLDASHLESGIYVLMTYINGKVQTKKLSVMK